MSFGLVENVLCFFGVIDFLWNLDSGSILSIFLFMVLYIIRYLNLYFGDFFIC